MSDNYRDGCPSRRIDRILIAMFLMVAWLANLGSKGK